MFSMTIQARRNCLGLRGLPAPRRIYTPARLSWARLLKRVFDIDIEHCPNCGGSLKIIAGSNPGALTMRVKATARTAYHAKVLRDQFVRSEVIFLHVGFTVSVVL